ncbi:MAG: glycoside hydrolase family 28 protein [Bacteroidota bacterium]
MRIIFFTGVLTFLSILNWQCQTNQPISADTFSVEKALAEEAAGWQKAPDIEERIKAPTFLDQQFNILDFGAKNDPTFDSRAGIMAAIAAASKVGSGRVVLPTGTYFSEGPIHLESNINLHLEEGARLFFSSNDKSYLPLVKVRWEGTVCWNYSPLIYAIDKENIAITGTGEIDGNARDWSMEWRKVQKPDKNRLRQMGNDTIPENQRVFGTGFLDLDGDGKDDGFGDGQQHYLRPTLIEFYNCQNILLDGVTVKNSPFWTVHPIFSKNVTIKNLKVYGGYLNDDGIDPDSCEDVLIEGCYIETEDDAISIKAGRDQDAWNRPKSKNILIRNCQLNSGVNSFCVGSEMSGGVENVFVEDCHILSGKHGLNFKCNLDRGGQVQNIFLRNITMDTVKQAMFIFRMDYHGYRGNNFPTKFNNFYASNIQCKTVEQLPFKIVGVAAEPISRVLLNNITIDQAGEASKFEFADQLLFHDVQVNGVAFGLAEE